MTYFADAFFYVALLNRHDEYHPRVIEWVEGFVGEIVTTQWILTEVATHFQARRCGEICATFLANWSVVQTQESSPRRPNISHGE